MMVSLHPSGLPDVEGKSGQDVFGRAFFLGGGDRMHRGAIDGLIDGLIVVFLVIAWSWNLPDGYLFKRFIRPWTRGILYCGLWHGWNMFAPEPLMVNRRWEALLFFDNGTVRHWVAPNCTGMGKVAAFLQVRERKYQDNMSQDQMRFLRPAFCEYLGRMYSTPQSRVEYVELYVNQQAVSPPNSSEGPLPWELRLVCTVPMAAAETARGKLSLDSDKSAVSVESVR